MNPTDNPSVLGVVHSLAVAVIGLLLVFNVIDWTNEQQGAVLLVIASVGAVVTLVWKSKVTPNAKVADLTSTAALVARTGALDAVRALAPKEAVTPPAP